MTVPAADGPDVAATNPVNVLREALVSKYRDKRGGASFFALSELPEFEALASVERLIEAVWIAKLEGRFEPLHEAFRPFEEDAALARFPKPEEPA